MLAEYDPRLMAVLFIRNLVFAVLVSLLAGLLINIFWPNPKARTQDFVYGIVGALMTVILLSVFGGGLGLGMVSLIVIEFLGSAVVVGLGRALS